LLLPKGALSDHAIEIDEHAVPKQVVHLGLARAVAGHEPPQGGGFVVVVVEDVQPGVAPAGGGDQVNRVLEGLLLAGCVVSPEGVRLGTPCLVRFARLRDAKEVLDAVIEREGIALDIDEEVARGRFR
jgi:hypothetical protein